MTASTSSGNMFASLKQQELTEDRVLPLLQAYASVAPHQHSLLLELWKEQHVAYLERGLDQLPAGFEVLDSSRPWLCYWILHSLTLIGGPVDPQFSDRTIDFLQRCQDPAGGYGGGPGQITHLATTYAAVSSLVTLGGETALSSIQRDKVLQFLLRMKDPSGGFRMHEEGEMDVRGCYTALTVAHMLDIMVPELLEKVGEHIASCQTYEGGIGGEPGAEAHGGYTFCGLAALVLANQVEMIDLPRLANWAVFRQSKVEGGFQGRTNKLVDGCYSFWQGGIFPLLQQLMPQLMAQHAGLYAGPIENMDNDDETHKTEAAQEASVCISEGKNASDQASRRGFGTASQNTPHVISAEKLFPVIDTVMERPTTFARCEEAEFTHGRECEQSSSSGRHGEASSSSPGLKEELQYGPLFNPQALQGYLLLCCQVLEGGLRDKPGKPRDYYHTCYCLSGLSVCQYSSARSLNALPPPRFVLGPYSNLLDSIHPVCNVKLDRYYEARDYFRKK